MMDHPSALNLLILVVWVWPLEFDTYIIYSHYDIYEARLFGYSVWVHWYNLKPPAFIIVYYLICLP